MKRIALLVAMAMLLGDAAVAQTATTVAPMTVTPILSGTYIIFISHVCQVSITSSQNVATGDVGNIAVQNSGDLNHNVGTVTFNHTTGQLTTAISSTDGSPILFNGTGYVFSEGPQSQTVPYSNNGHKLYVQYRPESDHVQGLLCERQLIDEDSPVRDLWRHREARLRHQRHTHSSVIA
jgi:hypothetical protein